jgi:hypothetical protein
MKEYRVMLTEQKQGETISSEGTGNVRVLSMVDETAAKEILRAINDSHARQIEGNRL